MTKRQPQASPALQQFQTTHYIVKELASGSFGEVYASINKQVANKIIADNHSDLATLYAALRKAIQAAKISKAIDMAEEIALVAAMRAVVSSESSPLRTLPFLFDSESPDTKQVSLWITIDLLEGGTLEELTKQFWGDIRRGPTLSPIPTALLWHWIAQMAETFLYLHQGIRPDGSRDDNWTPVCHNDIHCCNIMFRSPRSSTPQSSKPDFSDYPDLVLSDFGNAVVWYEGIERHRNWQNLKEKQVSDMLCELEKFLNHVEDDINQLTHVFNQNPPNFSPYYLKEDVENTEKLFLKRIAQIARQKRRKLYKPLPLAVRQYFETPVVSDEELETFVENVRKTIREEANPTPETSSSGKSILHHVNSEGEHTSGCGCIVS